MTRDRRNFDANDDGVFVCDGDHEKAAGCEFRKLSNTEILEIINELRKNAKLGNGEPVAKVIKAGDRFSFDWLSMELANKVGDGTHFLFTSPPKILESIMREYDEMSDDGAFEGNDHPIVQLANGIDMLNVLVNNTQTENEQLRKAAERAITIACVHTPQNTAHWLELKQIINSTNAIFKKTTESNNT